MLKLRFPLLSFLVAVILVISCQKELSETHRLLEFSNAPNVTISVAGRIIDEGGKPVQGAQVIGINASTVTNINGEFLLKNVGAYDRAAFVQVKKHGYFTGSRTFVATQGQTNYIEVELLNNTKSGSFDAATGGTISLTSGATVTLPANGVVIKSSNAAYTGAVDVAIKWIDPTSDALLRQMPGDLRGINENNAEMGLQSFGMLAVELTSPSGEALQVAPGKKASLKFPIPALIAASAPATVPLWSFNDSTGLWKYEGSATKVGSNYEAQVSHFSFWNCDAQFPVVDFTATVKDPSGNPVAHALVRIKRTATNSITGAYTDNLGIVKGSIPQNEPLTLDVSMPYSFCNTTVIHNQNIGPFSSPANLSISVSLATLQNATISGNVEDCNGAPVLKGYVILTSGTKIYQTVINNGTFAFSANVCSGSQTSLVAIDSATNQQGSPIMMSINPGLNTVATLVACGTSSQQFINYTFNGGSYSMTAPSDSLFGKITPAIMDIRGYSGPIGNSFQKQIKLQTQTLNSIGSYNVLVLTVKDGNITADVSNSNYPNLNLTEYAAVGGFLAGNFSGTLVDSLSNQYPIQGNFRIRRQQ